MRLFTLVIAVLLLCCINITCSDPASPVEANKAVFSIYLLKDPSITTADAYKMELSKLELRANPVLTDFSFKTYYLTTHIILLKTDVNSVFGGNQSSVFQKHAGTPFVVMAENERIYLGSFHHIYADSSACVPSIKGNPSSNAFSNSKRVRISMAAIPPGTDDFVDMRYDERIVAALHKSGKLYVGGSYLGGTEGIIYSP